jgi:hypothetical protein
MCWSTASMTCSGSSFGVGLPVEHPFHPSGVELAAARINSECQSALRY